MNQLLKAEDKLLQIAREHFSFGSTASFEKLDTQIDGSALSCMKNSPKEALSIHSIKLSNEKAGEEPPLVILHGYMNAAAYFYRNMMGLSKYVPEIYSLDLLGWGASSHPKFLLKDKSVSTAEDFFCESLEEFRKSNNIKRMSLAGHSMGGYLATAYCERYPERVDRLILISPVGVPVEDQTERKKSYTRSFISKLFDWGLTPGMIVRSLPMRTGHGMVSTYIERRLPTVQSEEERAALSDYLYYNAILPGSGEFALQSLLNSFAFARYPLVHRIPKLKVPKITCLYGSHDWMDARGAYGLPNTSVLRVRNAGHLLQIDNQEEFMAGILMALGKNVPQEWSTPETIYDSSTNAN